MALNSLKQWGILFVFLQASAIMQLTIPKLTIAQNNPSNSPKTIYFGFAQDAYPVSSLETDSPTNLAKDTFCYQLYQYLKTEKFQSYQFELIPIPYTQRFGEKRVNHIGKDVELDINCASISITDKRIQNLQSHKDGRTFSLEYFETPSKYIIRKDKLNLQSALENRLPLGDQNKIAVINGTTQHDFLKKYYRNSDIELLKSRSEIQQTLENNNNIVAYLTDDIILKGMLNRLPKITENYRYVTNSPTIDTEKLGIVIYNKELLGDTINQWINDTGKDWISKKNQELDGQLKEQNNIGSNFIYVGILIAVVCLLIGIYCFLQRNKSSKESNQSLETETQRETQEQKEQSSTYNYNNIYVAGEIMKNKDQRQSLSISGNVISSDINQESNVTINEDSYNVTSEDLNIDKVLIGLEDLIKNLSSLNSERKNEVLEEIEHIKQASQNPDDEQMKRQAKSAWRVLKGVPAGLKNANETVEQFNKLLPYIKTFFGF